MVHNCPDLAEETWTAHSGFADWVVHWDVCPLHGERLDAKEAWASDYGEAPSWQRTILMGHDLGQRQLSRPDAALARSE